MHGIHAVKTAVNGFQRTEPKIIHFSGLNFIWWTKTGGKTVANKTQILCKNRGQAYTFKEGLNWSKKQDLYGSTKIHNLNLTTQ